LALSPQKFALVRRIWHSLPQAGLIASGQGSVRVIRDDRACVDWGPLHTAGGRCPGD